MTQFQTGVHTIEFKTPKPLKLEALPPQYDGAVRPEKGKPRHYILTLPKVYGVPEYSSPAETQQDIEEAFTAFADMGAGYPTTTRIDYRFDDHSGTYADHLQLMTVLVNLVAAISGIYNRRVSRLDENDVKTSIRCMPDDNDRTSKYGVEYYDKYDQRGNSEHGNARLELRRLNMANESVTFIVKEWRDMLQSITKGKYLAMLDAHARSLYTTKQEDETATEFINRTRGNLIAYEEWNAIHKAAGKQTNHYERLPPLPKWTDVKLFLDDLTAQLDEVLAQSHSSPQHPEKVLNSMPF